MAKKSEKTVSAPVVVLHTVPAHVLAGNACEVIRTAGVDAMESGEEFFTAPVLNSEKLDTTEHDIILRKDGKPYFSSDLTAKVRPNEGTKTKIYQHARRLEVLTAIGSHCKNFSPDAYASNADVFINYWPARNLITCSSAPDDKKGYQTEKGSFKFAAISCREDGTLDTSKVVFTDTRKDL